MSYRLTIGQSLNYTQLLTDPTFSTVAGVNWDVSALPPATAQLQYSGGASAYLTTTEQAIPSDWADVYTVNNVLTKNTKYRVELTLSGIASNYSHDTEIYTSNYFYLEVFIGNISISTSQIYLQTGGDGVYYFDMWCQEDSKLILRMCCLSHVNSGLVNKLQIDSCKLYAYEWNNPSAFDPDVNDMSIVVTSSELFESFTTNYTSEVTLYGDAYDYILAQGMGKAIDVKLESNYTGTWNLLKQGVILTNDCIFEGESVKVKIEDIVSTFMSEKINTELTFKSFYQANYYRYLLRHYSNWSADLMNFHKVTDGTHANYSELFKIWLLLRDYVNELSQGLIKFESDYYLATDGNFEERLALGFGKFIGGGLTEFYLTQSFSSVFDNLNKILNNGGYIYYNDGWKFKLEPFTDLLTSATIDFYDVNNNVFKYNPDYNLGSIQIGYTEKTNIYENGSMTYNSIDSQFVNTGQNLNLISSWVRDSIMIGDVSTVPTPDLENVFYIIQYSIGIPYNLTTDFGALDNVAHGYNGDIILENNMQRRLSKLSSDMSYRDERNTHFYSGTSNYGKIYEFEMYISEGDINSILYNPYRRIQLINSTNNTIGFIMNLEWNLKTHIANIKLLGT